MTRVRFQNRPAERSFNNLMDGFFSAIPSIYRDDLSGAVKHSVPVNILETEKDFVLEVVAPGFTKEDFKIDLVEDTLTISTEKKEDPAPGTEKKLRQEYKIQSFKRSFTVDKSINVNGISAKYVNGILTLNLPKAVEVKEAAKQITIE